MELKRINLHRKNNPAVTMGLIQMPALELIQRQRSEDQKEIIT